VFIKKLYEIIVIIFLDSFLDRSFDLFSSWNDLNVAELSSSSVTEYHGYQQVVVEDGRFSDFIYICLKVSCLLVYVYST